MTRTPNWHDDVFFGLHFDLHPMKTDTSLGAETTYEHIRTELEKVRPDFVQYDCKGHVGYAGYPTKIGVPSPGVKKDALKIWRKVTRDLGIPLSVHYSGVWDQVQAELHPDWQRLKADGTPYGTESGNPYSLGADSPYDEELLIPQLKEVIDLHDIDGVWVDGECWAAGADWSETARALFTAETGITEIPMQPGDPHWAEFMAFHRRRFEAHIKRYADALHAHKPGFAVCSNWAYTIRMPDEVTAPLDYLSGDFTWAFGLDSAEAEAKFMDSRGLPWDLMAWGFTTGAGLQNALWTTKSAEHLQIEAASVAANGGAFWIYDQPTRSGRLIDWHMDVFADVAKFMRARQTVCRGTQSEPHVAVLHSQSHFYANNHPEGTNAVYNPGVPNTTLIGALQLLLDNGYHADVMNEDALLRRLDEYPVIAVMEQTHLPQTLRDALLAWVKRGGKLLLTGSHIVQDYGAALGVKAAGEPVDGVFNLPGDTGSAPISGEWQPVRVGSKAKALAPLLRTQELRSAVKSPSATLVPYGAGSIAAIYGPIATAYGKYRYSRTREYAAPIFKALTGTMPVEVDAPYTVHFTVRRDGTRRIIHLINSAPSNSLSPANPRIEGVVPTGPITVRVQCPKRPRSVTLVPKQKELAFTWRAGVLTLKLDSLDIHTAIVIQ